MRQEKRWRYYCDFCKKSGGHKFHMERHEKSCTANPDRKCGMCDISGNEQIPITELIESIGKGGAGGLKKLRKLSGNCPACMLAAIRQSRINDCSLEEDGFQPIIPDSHPVDFDWKEESKSFWSEVTHDHDHY